MPFVCVNIRESLAEGFGGENDRRRWRRERPSDISISQILLDCLKAQGGALGGKHGCSTFPRDRETLGRCHFLEWFVHVLNLPDAAKLSDAPGSRKRPRCLLPTWTAYRMHPAASRPGTQPFALRAPHGRFDCPRRWGADEPVAGLEQAARHHGGPSRFPRPIARG